MRARNDQHGTPAIYFREHKRLPVTGMYRANWSGVVRVVRADLPTPDRSSPRLMRGGQGGQGGQGGSPPIARAGARVLNASLGRYFVFVKKCPDHPDQATDSGGFCPDHPPWTALTTLTRPESVGVLLCSAKEET